MTTKRYVQYCCRRFLCLFAAFAAALVAFGVGVLEQIFGIAGRNNFMAAAARIVTVESEFLC
jgi:hypothetical protein